MFLHVVQVKKHTEMLELHTFRVQFSFCVQFLHVSVFSDWHNMQKSVTQIIYLGPLPRELWPLRNQEVSSRLITVKAWGACYLYYRQSSSIKQLVRNCNRIEAKQQSGTRSKSSTNLILRISITESSYPIIQSSVVAACLCLCLYQLCSHLPPASFATKLYNDFQPNEKQQSCIHPITVSIKPS